MTRALVFALGGAALVAAAAGAGSQRPDGTTGQVLDDFRTVSNWVAAPSEGVRLTIGEATGAHGRAMQLDFDFGGGAGYAVARRKLALDLPENYVFSFWIRADAPVNNFEFKITDPSGENVWWVNRRAYEFPREWRRVTVRKKALEFAWGPAGGGRPVTIDTLEFAITAGTGGRGTVWIADLRFTPLDPERPYTGTPRATASSALPGQPADGVLAGRAWHSDRDAAGPQWFAVDFGAQREYGGLVLDWDPVDYAARYEVQVSDDGIEWNTIREVPEGKSGRAYVALPEAESRRVRLLMERSAAGRGFGLRGLDVRPPEFAATPAAFWAAVARDAPRGSYPRYLAGEQVYWTVTGVDGGADKALVNEDGAIEPFAGGFSVEPFLDEDGTLVTWADVSTRHSLADGGLPVPTVTWERPRSALEVTAFATGPRRGSTLVARYRVGNRSAGRLRGRLFLAVRPFQVNPSTQFLGVPGGPARVREVTWNGHMVALGGATLRIVPRTLPDRFGAVVSDRGEIVEHLRRGEVPAANEVVDPQAAASAVLAWNFDLPAGGSMEVAVEIRRRQPADLATAIPPAPRPVGTLFDEVVRDWRERLGRVRFDVPPEGDSLVRAIAANLGYVLVDRDGQGLQPGARSYARSWIRDGALTSAALLRLGHADEVKEFLDWYAGYQFPSGKVPCVVDRRGADPVAENDSHGEFVFAVAEYYRFTGDLDFVRRVWPHVVKAVEYLDTLRQQRRTPEYREPSKQVFFGLLPESISHEGYSDKPMHSYWDDFFALKGLADGTELARALGDDPLRVRFGAMHDEFRADLAASIRRAIEDHAIDFVPGCAEKGDSDATSTTIALAPCGARGILPEAALRRTFERYAATIRGRRDATLPWKDYTPYEWRTVGSLLRLGWPDRAWDAIGFLMDGRRPDGWSEWAEVVVRELRKPQFLGDMPHTWVGSDMIRSALDLFAYERDEDQALVIGAGLPASWTKDPKGVAVHGLRTRYGPLDYTVRPAPAGGLRVEIGSGLKMPPGGIVIGLGGRERTVRSLPAVVNIP